MSSSRTLAGIVTFNPEISRLYNNILAVFEQAEKIIIIDNGSDNIDDIYGILDHFKTVSVIDNGENAGIARALNQIGEYAVNNKFDYFMTLDQDSIVGQDMISKMLELKCDRDIGMICPYINRYNDFISDNSVQEIKSAITSGSLMDTEVWKQTGGFWEYLFIDEVDHDFCYRLRSRGFRILQANNCSINHVIGEPKDKVVLGHRFHPTHHSPIRRYYMTRNSLLMLYLYPGEKEPFPHRIWMLFRILVSITVAEENKIEKYKSIFRGITDAVRWILAHPQIRLSKEYYYLKE